MDTVRTTGEYKNYFLDSCNEYAIKKNKHVVTGHIHYDRREENFDNCASAGYQNAYYVYEDSNIGDIAVISDLHFGIKENEKNIKNILTRLLNDKVNMVIFLGDTFDMALTDNTLILHNALYGYLDEVFKKIPTVLIVGNHDINLKDSKINEFLYSVTGETNLRKYLLENYNLDIVEEFETKDLVFIHGHQFDVNVYKFKWLYLMAFRITDFINPAIKTIDKLLKKFKLGNR